MSSPEGSDPELAAAFEAIDSSFARSPRPDKFTDHPYCEECTEADEYFREFTPLTISVVTDPPETLPISFLTDDAFLYLIPGILRWLPQSGPHYCVGDVLFHVENRLHRYDPAQRGALRDLLYVVYDRLEPEIRATPFDYSTIWRILNELDKTEGNAPV